MEQLIVIYRPDHQYMDSLEKKIRDTEVILETIIKELNLITITEEILTITEKISEIVTTAIAVKTDLTI
jgi:hypothetical protein